MGSASGPLSTDQWRIFRQWAATLGPSLYAQVYQCRFVDGASTVFRVADIEAALAEEVETWNL